MNGRVARELRKIAEYHPRNLREYEHWKFPRKRLVPQLTLDGKVDFVERVVDCIVVECISGDRKVYQHLKRQYSTFREDEVTLQPLPSKQELKELEQNIFKQEKKEDE